jgi:hypothetical protein
VLRETLCLDEGNNRASHITQPIGGLDLLEKA